MIKRRPSYFEEMNEDKITELVREMTPILTHRQANYIRYSRKPDANTMMRTEDGSLLVPMEYYISNVSAGYLGGKPPQVSVATVSQDENANETEANVERESFHELLHAILRDNDFSSLHSSLMHSFVTKGAAYLGLYEDSDNRIRMYEVDALTNVIVYDYSVNPMPVANLRLVGSSTARTSEQTEEEIPYIEITTRNWRRLYSERGIQLDYESYDEEGNIQSVPEQEILWKGVPFIGFEQKDGLSVHEPARGLIPLFETMLFNVQSITEYNDTAKLVLSNMTLANSPTMPNPNDPSQEVQNPAWVAEVSKLLDMRVLVVGPEGEVKWLLKELDYRGIIEMMEAIERLIYSMCFTPSMTDKQFAGNTSGTAMSYKMYSLEQYAPNVFSLFRIGYTAMIVLLAGRMSIIRNTNFRVSDLKINFETNKPSTLADKALAITQLTSSGVISARTGQEELGLDVDYHTDQEYKLQERRALFETATELDKEVQVAYHIAR